MFIARVSRYYNIKKKKKILDKIHPTKEPGGTNEEIPDQMKFTR